MTQRNAFPILGQRPQSQPHPLAGLSRNQASPAVSLYFHVPFCFHKCHYCDFYSIVDTRDRQEPFTNRLIAELRALAPFAAGRPLETIFVGGGTPTLLRPDLWQRILAALAEAFDLSAIRGDEGGGGGGEFTVECNPETASAELFAVLRGGGVNRISLGAQSFEAGHLKTLERWHDPENVARAVELARRAGIGRQSIDLIFGVPGQTLADWDRDLARALALGTEHMSCYGLTYEPNTAMTARLRRGDFQPTPEDLEAEMFLHTVATLRAAGLERYEVSNFAKPGAECRHNLAYWRQRDWLAAGPSASGHVAGWRWKNVPRLDDYLTSDLPWPPTTDVEPPDASRALVECIMTGLRLAEGLPAEEICERADRLAADQSADRPSERLRSLAARLHAEGVLHDSTQPPFAARWALTDEGFLIADRLIVRFMEALDTPS